MATEFYLVHGARTAFGKFTGAFRDVSAVDLAVVAARAAVERSGVQVADVDNVVIGNVHQSSDPEGILTARHIGLKSGTRVEAPAITINRVCGSGMQSVVTAALSMAHGESEVALVGGTENMTQVPFVIRGARTGLGLGSGKMDDVLWEALLDSFCGFTMAGTAENVGKKYGLTRDEVDEFGALSHTRALAAQASGVFQEEIVPVEVKTKQGLSVVDTDEIPRPTTKETLAKLPARFIEDGLVTAGNASGLCDGAAVGVLVTGEYAQRHNLKPLGRLVSWGIAGVEPSLMGLGPVAAIRMALERAGMTLGQMDLIEINEAFAAQFLGCQRELDFPIEAANVNGGAIALGHPLGASGMRLTLTMLLELHRRGQKYGVASLCIGGGQGIATVWEAV
ncbi:acetyl-CoA C-acyltransferase [Alicyclobacillus sp. ALC3]|uniref:acetyl-CoA C-acyltransferase n=1 Tax=Alicyclobacillus sp. ALC3 TaxID=2796143 RepID=UPI002377DB3D|nr:acetyl-CoA C-acyltransferase [Alicyclobacillus sp. ALC3]WDL95671.1 acetyl-CoA C-acyltransferase [Alicyclobacillus sp. ALC3]